MIALLVLAFIAVAIITTYILHVYANLRSVPWYVTFSVWIGWYLCFLVVVMVPLDVSSTSHGECTKEYGEAKCEEPWVVVHAQTLFALWNVIYWTTYALSWAVYPMMQSYCTAGEFTVGDKIRAAIKENLIFYGVCAGVVLIIFLWIIANRPPGDRDVRSIAIAAANTWGLFLLICLLGYGIPEIPRRIWRLGNRELTLKYYHFEIINRREEFETCKKEFYTTLKSVRKYDERIRQDDVLREYVDVIISKCPMEYKDVKNGDGDFDPHSYSKLIQLHKRVITTTHNYHRAAVLYRVILMKAIALEDVIECQDNPKRVVEWTAKPKRTHQFANLFNKMEWLWKAYLEAPALRAAAVFVGLLSVIIVWSECSFPFSPELSIFSLLLNVEKLDFLLQWLFVFCTVLYISFCAYWALFQLRIFNFYRLVPHHQTDENSLIFSASYLCRLIAPIAYNFLLMSHKNEAIFLSVMGPIELTPFLGGKWNLYFPLVLLVFCISNIFDLYTKFVLTCCIKKFHPFVFDESYSDQKIERGKEILKHERELVQQGIDSTSFVVTTDTKSAGGIQFPNFRKIFNVNTPPSSQRIDRVQLLRNKPGKYGSSTRVPDEEDPFDDYNNA